MKSILHEYVQAQIEKAALADNQVMPERLAQAEGAVEYAHWCRKIKVDRKSVYMEMIRDVLATRMQIIHERLGGDKAVRH